ncbi:MAG: DUF2726 domain-containing protein [Burkholderiales bacterium]|nr:DUF2726 domain-containing protein [Burkholderiales bacterium]
MKPTTLLFLALAIAVFVLAMRKLKATGTPPTDKKGSFAARSIATANEQKMFWRLVEAFPGPEHVVLTQVSFGAMLKAKDGASRYSFSQKMADFVVVNKGFKVLAAIELDDSSHKGKEASDANRDAMLIEAGYKVLRYPIIPDVKTLRADLLPTPEKIEDTTPMHLPEMTAD